MPCNEYYTRLREAWQKYWDLKNMDPVRAEDIKHTLSLITKKLRG